MQFFTSSGLGRQLLHSIYTRVNPGADKQRLNQLVRWHSNAQCSPEEAFALLLDLGILRRRLRVLLRLIFQGSAVLLLPVCAFVNAASFSSENIFVRTLEGSFEEKSTTFEDTFSGYLGGCRLNLKNQTLKNTCVEHFTAMFAAKRPPQRRSNSSKRFFVRRNILRSKVSFEENTPSGGSRGIVHL